MRLYGFEKFDAVRVATVLRDSGIAGSAGASDDVGMAAVVVLEDGTAAVKDMLTLCD